MAEKGVKEINKERKKERMNERQKRLMSPTNN